MKKSWWIAILLSLVPLAIWGRENPDRYVPGEPRFVNLPPQRVLAITAEGDPNEAAGPAYRKLFKAFYAHADKAERRHAGSPLARWAAADLESPKAGWQGTYALPVSRAFPAVTKEGMRMETWEYGPTAEILHIGSYADMSADIAALKAFIARNGFVVKGSYEEVYLKGPGMILKGDPSRYQTLIRFGVESVGEPLAPIARKNIDAPASQAGGKE